MFFQDLAEAMDSCRVSDLHGEVAWMMMQLLERCKGQFEFKEPVL